MRLIDADALGIGKANRAAFNNLAYADGWNSAIEMIANAPTIDAVPVVRCKDCRWCSPRGLLGDLFCSQRLSYPYANDFCSLGERRDDD